MEAMKLRCRTRKNGSPEEKAKIFFACHPGDLSRTLDMVCEDIFKTHDCYIYHTEEGSVDIDGEKADEFFAGIRLFVIPVTSRLLMEEYPVVDAALSYAWKQQIPVLPILMEPDVEGLYCCDERFCDMPYIDPCGQEDFGSRYRAELASYLDIFLDGLTFVTVPLGRLAAEGMQDGGRKKPEP